MRKFRLTLINSTWIDITIPEGQPFDFMEFVKTCRCVGYMLSPDSYIRWDLVAFVLPWTGDEPPSLNMPMPNAPTSGMKQ